MRREPPLVNILLTFFITTACITILEGTLGAWLYPEQRFGCIAFLSPPLFALLTTISNLFMISRKELSVRQVVIRRFLQLVYIECIVFGLNMIAGNTYEPVAIVAIILGVAIIYIIVNLMMWMNDRRFATDFNRKLKVLQAEAQSDPDRTLPEM